MDIVLGVSMTPTSVRMVLVEGEKADGLTVDHDAFNITADEGSATASEQVVTAILGTRESAAEGGHRLVSTGVAWRDHDEAAALRDALAARNIDDVMLVSELHAAGALAQAVGRAVGYQRTALMFLERDTATVSVVETSDGSIVKVQSQDLHAEDAIAELTAMIAGLEDLEAPPEGVFVVGSGVSIAAIKLQLESATSLPVSAPDEPELALARGAALASANAPMFEASTVGLAFAKDSAETQIAGADYLPGGAALAYSEVEAEPELLAYDLPDFPDTEPVDDSASTQGRKPFLLVGSALTSIFVVGVTALVVSLAVSIRPTVDERPPPAEAVIVPTEAAPAPVAQKPQAPEPLETIPAPKPVVQDAPQAPVPRTVFAEAPIRAPAAPAPAAPAPAPAAPAPVPVPEAPPIPVPVAPAPIVDPVPVAPYVPPPVVAPVIPPPVIVLPKPKLPSIFRPPWDPAPDRRDSYDPPQSPQVPWPTQPQPRTPSVPSQPPAQQWPSQPQAPSQQWPVTQPPAQQWPGSGSDSGRRGSGSDSGGRGSGSGRSGSDGSIWPWPIFGGG